MICEGNWLNNWRASVASETLTGYTIENRGCLLFYLFVYVGRTYVIKRARGELLSPKTRLFRLDPSLF